MMQTSLKIISRHFLKSLPVILVGVAVTTAQAQERVIVDITPASQSRWEFYTDQVMGGQSNGDIRFERDNEDTYIRLRGSVSTANNGGFIQARIKLERRLSDDAQGIILRVRGNGERYYIHTRTRGTVFPWQYYQASFKTTGVWQQVFVPFKEFESSGGMLGKSLKPRSIRSIALVAYGKNYEADVSLSRLSLY